MLLILIDFIHESVGLHKVLLLNKRKLGIPDTVLYMPMSLKHKNKDYL